QARRVGQRLVKQGVDRIYSSTLLRARQTAQPLADALGVGFDQIHDLREVELQGVVRDDDSEDYREQIRAALKKRASWDAFPGAERSKAVRKRVGGSIDRIVKENPGQRVAIFCHGGVIQIFVSMILGLRDDIVFYAFNAGITSIRAMGEQRTLWRLNDISHLEDVANIS
ncbi:MAG TPA: histidine phosphatase family protein, partial [Dehalococcoidia bacterium]|nr:histidine phosphatase family protein [Dehalococcoidia bacterium]